VGISLTPAFFKIALWKADKTVCLGPLFDEATGLGAAGLGAGAGAGTGLGAGVGAGLGAGVGAGVTGAWARTTGVGAGLAWGWTLCTGVCCTG